MSITDELREFIETHLYLGATALGGWKEAAFAIADHIDAAHHKAEDEWREKNGDMWLKGYNVCHTELMEGHPVIAADLENAGWVRLPVDADGEIIRVGDMMERGKARGHVIALMLSEYPKKWGGELHWAVQLEGEQAPTALDGLFLHYHEPTVEDVLSEMLEQAFPSDFMHRSEAIEAMVAEYAAKLRLADGEE